MSNLSSSKALSKKLLNSISHYHVKKIHEIQFYLIIIASVHIFFLFIYYILVSKTFFKSFFLCKIYLYSYTHCNFSSFLLAWNIFFNGCCKAISLFRFSISAFYDILMIATIGLPALLSECNFLRA